MSNSKKNKGNQRYPREMQKKDKKQKKAKVVISGFSTLNQVAGVPSLREHHSNIPISPVKRVHEPGLSCSICQQRIDTIATALTTSDGSYAHFDCVLEKLRNEENPREGQIISYIGSGNFGLCEKDENGKWKIIKTIPFESSEKNKAMKEFVEGLKS